MLADLDLPLRTTVLRNLSEGNRYGKMTSFSKENKREKEK